mgnify:FL=1
MTKKRARKHEPKALSIFQGIMSSNSQLTTMPFISFFIPQCFSTHDNKNSIVDDGIDFTDTLFFPKSFDVVATFDNRSIMMPSMNASEARPFDCNLIKREKVGSIKN